MPLCAICFRLRLLPEMMIGLCFSMDCARSSSDMVERKQLNRSTAAAQTCCDERGGCKGLLAAVALYFPIVLSKVAQLY